ncbi:MAG TPA: response regulator [Frankiaceae bacterium]|nr:response regulator [Frankiaceae bacterium]
MTDVLVVDDEPDITLICKLALSLAGFSVEERHCGNDALDYLATNSPDVVLLDLRLPDLSGWDVVDRLRESGRLADLSIVVFSAHASAGKAAAEAGCAGFLSKPFTPDELVAAVRAAAGKG